MGNQCTLPCFSVEEPSEAKEAKEAKEAPSPPAQIIYHATTYENTPEFTFSGLRTYVKIIRIVDGDTVDIALHHEKTGSGIYRHRVRLYGIDTPEKRPSLSAPHREIEIEASHRSTRALEQRIRANDDILLAHFDKADKYGRLLCTFYDKSGEDINRWMITQGYAVAYHGKTKKKWEPTLALPVSL